MLFAAGRAVLHAVVFSCAFGLGCSDNDGNAPEVGEEEEGIATGATCPPASTVTYENFVKGFMGSYCTRCHNSALTGDARSGAPLGHDFDTEAGIVFVGEHVDEHAAAGPNATNELMPPSGPKPTAVEREKLGEWIACATAGDD
jgi:hypothetical protein